MTTIESAGGTSPTADDDDRSARELAAEQRYIDDAYQYLADERVAAVRLRTMTTHERGGTFQARYERDVIEDKVRSRLDALDIGDAAICFGRLDMDDDPSVGEADGRYYIGRIAISDKAQDPVIVDWRAPVAEPFYRATGKEPMGILRRRHFTTRGRRLIGIEDELFGTALDGIEHGKRLQGEGALLAALDEARTGTLADIVSTIQSEQDEIIRSPMPGVLVVQGGPGTGKTVVALHRAAYLLYTHRFPLDGQGVLLVGPNRIFLRYISQVLPSLGETGVEQRTLPDLIPGVRIYGRDEPATGRLKGDLRMVTLIRRAVRQRQRGLRADLSIGYGVEYLRMSVAQSQRIVDEARRRFPHHNQARKFVVQQVYETLANSSRLEPDPDLVRRTLETDDAMRETLEWMWPVLTPGQLLHDFFGGKALVRAAAAGLLGDDEWALLPRPRVPIGVDVIFTSDDAPLLDEAYERLGRLPKAKASATRTYGHIVVDEAQDLSPMELRMLTRRSLNGSMTIVGDIAQATGAHAPSSWQEVLDHLPERRPPRRVELTVGYRIPGRIMDIAARVLTEAAPQLDPPVAVRENDGIVTFHHTEPAADVPPVAPTPTDEDRQAAADLDVLIERSIAVVRTELDAVGAGSIAVIAPVSMADAISVALTKAGIVHGDARRGGLTEQVTVVEPTLAKGLELDGVVVVEPAKIIVEEHQGMRALYVAVTRSTKRLAIVHQAPLPAVLGLEPPVDVPSDEDPAWSDC